jgi:DNA-binding PadR family transcriptional regulator
VNADQVYATLRRLERDGLVESDGACKESPPEGIRITASIFTAPSGAVFSDP